MSSSPLLLRLGTLLYLPGIGPSDVIGQSGVMQLVWSLSHSARGAIRKLAPTIGPDF